MERNSDHNHGIALRQGLNDLNPCSVLGEDEEYHLTQKWFVTIKQNSLQDLS